MARDVKIEENFSKSSEANVLVFFCKGYHEKSCALMESKVLQNLLILLRCISSNIGLNKNLCGKQLNAGNKFATRFKVSSNIRHGDFFKDFRIR